MKQLKKCFTFIAMSIIMLFVCMMPFSAISQKKAFALSTDYSGEDNTIYYFSDSAPIMDASTLSNLYGTDYNIVYDVQSNLTVQDVSGNYGQSYFDGFGENCVVIIEFKNIFANTTTLNSIFSNLKTQGCKVVFVSAVEQFLYTNIDWDNVDAFMQCQNQVYYFAVNAVKDIAARNQGDWEYTCILIDSRFVNLSQGYDLSDITNVYNSSTYLRGLFDELSKQLNLSGASASIILDQLNSYSMHLLVNTSEYDYIDLVTEDTYTIVDKDDLPPGTDDAMKLSAMGRSTLTTETYYSWWDIQGENHNDMTIYLLEIDPIIHGTSGPEVVLDDTLSETYGMDCQDDLEALMDALNNLGL